MKEIEDYIFKKKNYYFADLRKFNSSKRNFFRKPQILKSQKEKASAKSKSGDPQIQQILLVCGFAICKLICGPPTFAILTK
jgi:hypothetical protein